MRRGVAYIVFSIFFSACFEEAFHDGFMTFIRCYHERSDAILFKYQNEYRGDIRHTEEFEDKS